MIISAPAPRIFRNNGGLKTLLGTQNKTLVH